MLEMISIRGQAIKMINQRLNPFNPQFNTKSLFNRSI